MTPQNDILNDPNYLPVYDYGFVGLVDVMGDDSTPPQRARISYGKGTKSVSDDRNLLRYLIRHKHNTPVEMVELVFHLKMPIFVMRQHVRHRTATINEYSARYSEMSNEFYIPNHEDIALQSKTNKQGRDEAAFDPDALVEFETKEKVQHLMKVSYEQSFETYEELLKMGLARELARAPLPVANYTECFWKVNLYNFFHYCSLRRDSHAQLEIRMLADAMFELVQQRLPVSCEAFNDYIFEAVTFSRMEMKMLRDMFLMGGCSFNTFIKNNGGEESVLSKFGVSKRELEEFRAKISEHIIYHA